MHVFPPKIPKIALVLALALGQMTASSSLAQRPDWLALAQQAEQRQPAAWKMIEGQWNCHSSGLVEILKAAVCQRRTAFIDSLSPEDCRSVLEHSDAWECATWHRDPALARSFNRLVTRDSRTFDLYELLVKYKVFEGLGQDLNQAFVAGIKSHHRALVRELMARDWGFDPYEAVAYWATVEEMELLIEESFSPERAKGGLVAAVRSGHVPVFELLVRHGVTGDPLFSHALGAGTREMIPHLLAAGLRPTEHDIRSIVKSDDGDFLRLLADTVPPIEVAAARLSSQKGTSLDFLEDRMHYEQPIAPCLRIAGCPCCGRAPDFGSGLYPVLL